MLCSNYFAACSFSLLLVFHYAIAEILTISLIGTIGGAIAASGWFKWDVIKDNTVCRYMECCNNDHVPFNITKLRMSLSEKLFGQPLVNELVNVLQAHKETLEDADKHNKKALVISLHGWPGVGKNYAATIIAEALYAKGMQSKFVKLFMGKKDFGCSNLQQKKDDLVATLNTLVKKCPRSLIIFDEIHDICPSVLDAIKPMLDHHHAVDGVDYRDTIFLLISNIAGQEIAEKLLELYNNGAKRVDVDFHDFEPIIRRTAYFQGGFEKATVIAHHLIDHYVPFLPLEQHHVEMCARATFKANNIDNPTEKMMLDALSVITYGPNEDQPIFANNGCKRFTKHVPYVIQKNRPKEEL